jgi:hypothetical protein
LLTALAIALNFVPALQQSGITQALLRNAILALVLFGLWRGLAATNASATTRRVRFFTVPAALLIWEATVWSLAAAGLFAASSLLPVAIFLPVLIGVPLVLRSRWLGEVLDHTPPTWLIGLQVYRVFGSIFVLGWLVGQLPGAFALPAGLGDTLVGLLALPVAGLVLRNRAAGVAWNVLGLLDLANAVLLGILTSSGPLQLIVPDRPNVVGAYPLVLIPGFAVPLSVLLHSASLRQLRRLARRAGATTSARTASPAAVQYSPASPAN